MYFRPMILVTGGTGLVGAHLLRHLVQKDQRKIRATYRSVEALETTRTIFGYELEDVDSCMNKIEWVQADLFDLFDVDQVMDGVKTVFHCAAFVSFQPSHKKRVLEGNPAMTGLLVNAALKHNVDAFVHVSSVAAIGASEDGSFIHENTEWKDSPSNSAYSISKYESELHIWRGMEEGLNVGVVNPGIILGPGPWLKGSSKFFHTFYNGFKFYTTGKTGFVDVKDVVEILVRIEEKKAFGKRFIAVGENAYFKDLFNTIADYYQKPRPSILPSRFFMEILWRLEWLRSLVMKSDPLVTKETTRSANAVRSYTAERAIRELDISFTPLKELVPTYGKLYVQDRSLGRVK